MTAMNVPFEAWVVAAGTSDAARAKALENDPDFRRATTNVRLAASAVEVALAKLPLPLGALGLRVGLVVATGHGELEPTAGFLLELGRSNVARPLLFQNSLHNTVTGFLAQRLRIEGPVTTVSDGMYSGEDALDVARTLLLSDADVVLVVGVDTFPPALEELLPSLYPVGFRPADRAAAVVLANRAARARFPDAVALGPVERSFEPRAPLGSVEGFFDAGAVAVLAEAVSLPGPERVVVRELLDGNRSTWTLRWENR